MRVRGPISKNSTAIAIVFKQMKHARRARVQPVLQDRPARVANDAWPARLAQGGRSAMKKSLLAMLCVLAAGCSTRGQVNPDVMQLATAPLTCTTKAECDTWWQRARTWVTDHSRYEVTATTDSLIQTAGPDGGKRALAYQITKTANNDGTSTIGFAAHCDSSLGCKPNPWEAGADFKQFVRGGNANQNPPAGTPTPSAARPTDAMPGQTMPSPTGEPVSQ
jgi:hypothetical protein